MTQVTLPRTNQTGTNEWEDVEANDRALRDVINGNLDNDNIKSAANIAGSKLADASIPYAKLKPYTASAQGSVVTLSTSDQVYAKIENVPPGLYLALATVTFGSMSDVVAAEATISHTGGTATRVPGASVGPAWIQALAAGDQGSRNNLEIPLFAAYSVSVQTTLQVLVKKTSLAGSGATNPNANTGGLLIFGFRS